jgi:xylose isomerase
MVGTVSLWQTLELLWQIKKGGFSGTIYFDTFPDRLDPERECAANVAMMRRLERILDRIPAAELNQAQMQQDAVAAARIFQDAALQA